MSLSSTVRTSAQGRSCILCGGDDKQILLWKHGYRIARCSCGMVYADCDSREIDFDELYRERYPPEAFLPQRNRKMRNSVRELRKLEVVTGGRRLLDIGSSYGFFLDVAKKRGWRASGVEPAADAAAFSRRQYDVEVFTGYLSDAPYPRHSFDVVTIRHVLEHAPEPLRLLAEAAAMLRPGGVLLVAVPNQGSLASRALGSAWWWIDPPTHLSYFNAGTLTRAVRSSGFREVQQYTARGDDEHIGFYLAFQANHLLRRRARPVPAEGARSARDGLAEAKPDRWRHVRAVVEGMAIPLRPVGGALDSFGLGSELVMIARLG